MNIDEPCEPVVLVPHYDPTTATVVHTEWAGVQPTWGQNHTGVVPQLAMGPDGTLIMMGPDKDAAVTPLSQLPRERMADDRGARWDQIEKALRDAENNPSSAQDVVMHPGGALEVVNKGQTPGDGRSVSRLPSERMAATYPGLTASDFEELRLLDPKDAENWTPRLIGGKVGGTLWGFTFELTPPIPPARHAPQRYTFLVFRSPSERGWRVTPLYPNLDQLIGSHKDHMVSVRVGGATLAVICGPGGRPAHNLAEVRTFAGKWTAYASRRLLDGHVPTFS